MSTPVPETVTFAVLFAKVEFAVAVNVSVALFEPLTLFIVNQVWSLAAVQVVFDMISNVLVLPPAARIVNVLAETARAGDEAQVFPTV